MTHAVGSNGTTNETGPSAVDTLAGAGRTEDGRPTGDPAAFEALVARAATRNLGQKVASLPTGRAAEQVWARWAPSSQALGARVAPSGGLSGSASTGGLTPGSIGGQVGGDLFTAGRTGVVFPVAANVGEAVVNAAAEHLGVPYLWGGTDAEHGFDCSGLVQDAYRQIGVELPKWSRHQATMGIEIPSHRGGHDRATS